MTMRKTIEVVIRYPDCAGIYARKAQGRRQRASIPFSEKLDALDALRARVEPVVREREARRHRRTTPRTNRP